MPKNLNHRAHRKFAQGERATYPRRTGFWSVGLATAGVGLALSWSTAAQASTIVFSEDFETSAGTAFSTSGSIGTSSVWSITNSGADWGAKIDGGLLTLTNDASGASNANGWIFASTNTSSFASPYNSILSSNSAAVTWTFNMQQIRPDPAGTGSNNSYGVAFVLGGSNSSAVTSGSGYAIVLGQSGSTDPIRLVSYSNGLQGATTLTNIITATSPLNDVGANYLSLSVTYDPTTNGWTLEGRNDGITAFADPTSGSLSLLGSASDSTYTGMELGFLGGYWQGSTGATQTSLFDNIRVSLADSTPPVSLTYWDTNGTTLGSGNAGGAWSSAFWGTEDGTGSTAAFVNGSTAIFSAGTDGTGDLTITVDTAVSASGLKFEEGDITIAHGTGGSMTLTAPGVEVASNATATISESITSAVGLTKLGEGKLTLSGSNPNLVGKITIGGGILVADEASLGDASNDIALAGGTFFPRYVGTNYDLGAGRDLTGNGGLVVPAGKTFTVNGTTNAGLTLSSGSVDHSDGGTLIVNGTATLQTLTFIDPINVTALTPTVISGDILDTQTGGGITFTGNFSWNSGTHKFAVADSPAPVDLRIVGNLTSPGVSGARLQKVGAGTLRLQGDNTNLEGGIQLGVVGTSPANSEIGGRLEIVDGNGLGGRQFQFNDGTLFVDSASPVTFPIGVSVGAGLLGPAIFAGAAMEFTGPSDIYGGTGSAFEHKIQLDTDVTITGSFGQSGTAPSKLTLTGTHKFTVAGFDTGYKTPIQVNGPTFVANGTTVDLAATVTVTSGTLTGAGSIAGGVIVGDENGVDDAILSPGDGGIGSFTAGSFTLKPDAVLALELDFNDGIGSGISGDQIVSSGGSVDLGGAKLQLSVRNPGVFTEPVSFILVDSFTGVTGTFAGLSEGASFDVGGQTAFITYHGGVDGTDVLITIPEPSTGLLALTGLAGALGWRRRRRAA